MKNRFVQGDRVVVVDEEGLRGMDLAIGSDHEALDTMKIAGTPIVKIRAAPHGETWVRQQAFQKVREDEL